MATNGRLIVHCVVTSLWAGCARIQLPAEASEFYLQQNAQTGSRVYLASCLVSAGGPFRGEPSGRLPNKVAMLLLGPLSR